MSRAIGVLAMEHIAVGIVEDGTLAGPVRVYPPHGSPSVGLHAMPPEQIAETIRTEILALAGGLPIDAVGIGFPGIIRGGVVQDSPNLRQVKGFKLQATLGSLLSPAVPVHVLNDADAVAAGIAAKHGHLEALIRVWTLGSGVGFGRYPATDGIWEGGHIVVTLDPREKYCGCGGVGHLEGIVGGRSMRLRFLDREPDEVFDDAKAGDERCVAFVATWHRAIAAAMATSVHLDGPGRLFLAGPNARFVDLVPLDTYLHEMVKLTPVQGSAVEIVDAGDETAIVGAAVHALQTG
jgi:predicted NBD/HSP70 family sugar kinase